MITIIYEAHGTTYDNETHLSSGWYDVELSPLGIDQSKELGERYADKEIAAIFCSDLQRAYKTAEIAFSERNISIVRDKRLREVNYGDWTRKPSSEIEPHRADHLDAPYPKGESYRQAIARAEECLKEVAAKYTNKTVMIVGHRAPLYALEHWAKGLPLEDVLRAEWKWQPGWTYVLNK